MLVAQAGTARIMVCKAAVAEVRQAHWVMAPPAVQQRMETSWVVWEGEAMVVAVLRLVVLARTQAMEGMVVLAAMEQLAEQEGQPRWKHLAMDHMARAV